MGDFCEYQSILIDNLYEACILFEIVRNEKNEFEDMIFLEFNKSAEDIFDLKKESILGKKYIELLSEIDSKILKNRISAYKEVDRTGEKNEMQFYSERLHKWFKAKIIKCDENHIMNIVYEITELKEEERRLREMIDMLPLWLACGDKDGNYIIANKKYSEFFGKPLNEIEGHYYKEVLPPETVKVHETFFNECIKGKTVTFEDELICGDKKAYIHGVYVPMKDEAGNIIGIGVYADDITEIKQYQEQLMYMGTHDSLTGLFNRTFYASEIERLKKSREYPITIFMADVNGLKNANDLYGHLAGDMLLKKAAMALKETFRNEDVVARIGGDEFAVLLPNTDHIIAEKILERLKKVINNINKDNGGISLSLAIGVTTSEKSENFIESIKNADSNMYKDKLTYNKK